MGTRVRTPNHFLEWGTDPQFISLVPLLFRPKLGHCVSLRQQFTSEMCLSRNSTDSLLHHVRFPDKLGLAGPPSFFPPLVPEVKLWGHMAQIFTAGCPSCHPANNANSTEGNKRANHEKLAKYTKNNSNATDCSQTCSATWHDLKVVATMNF